MEMLVSILELLAMMMEILATMMEKLAIMMEILMMEGTGEVDGNGIDQRWQRK